MDLISSILGKIAITISGVLVSLAGFITPTLNSEIVIEKPAATTTASAEVDSSVEMKELMKPVATNFFLQKITETAPIIPNVIEVAPNVPDTFPNPSMQCLGTKNDWDAFVKKLSEIDAKVFNFWNSYYEYTYGTGNRPTELVPRFTYSFNKMTAEKSRFALQAEEIRKLASVIPKPPVGTEEDYANIKDAYLASVVEVESSFSIAYQAYRIIAEDKDGISINDLESARSLLADSESSYDKTFDQIAKVSSFIIKSQAALSELQANGCSYTFRSNEFNKPRTVVTTISEELRFTAYTPALDISKDYKQAVISIATKLPIKISESGSIKEVMKLSCDRYGSIELTQVERVNESQVRAVVTRTVSGGSNRKCKFIYTGSGETLGSNIVEFNI